MPPIAAAVRKEGQVADPHPASYPSSYPGASAEFARSLTDQMSGRVLFADFKVNKSIVTPEHERGLRSIASVMARQVFGYIPRIEGRASQTGPEANNVALAQARAEAVRDYLLRHGMQKIQIDKVVGLGSHEPIQNGPGEELGVNRSVYLYYSLPAKVVVKKRPMPKPRPKTDDLASNLWAIRLTLSGSAGHAGIGGAFAIGDLKNQLTGITRQGTFQGGGIGVGLQTPGVNPSTGVQSWSYFSTDAHYRFEDFDGTLCRLTAAGGGIFIGYAATYISFPNLGANSIDVGGWAYGTVGIDASSNVGWWNVLGM